MIVTASADRDHAIRGVKGVVLPPLTSLFTQTINNKRKEQKQMRRRLLTLVTAFMVTVATIAQTLSVKGVVVDENNEAVIGASVMISGSKNGTKTDYAGQEICHTADIL